MTSWMLASKTFIHLLVICCGFLLMGCGSEKTTTGFASLLVQQGKEVTPPANLSFPKDHLAHPEYGIEWWYLTANLSNQDHEPLWLQWTLFRIRNQETQNSWSDGQFYMAHFSFHSQHAHDSREMFANGGVGNASISSDAITINNWQLRKTISGLPSGLSVDYTNNANGSKVSVELQLDTSLHYLLHGDKGYSLKHPETELASYYYSLPHIDVSGRVNIAGETHSVSGNAWYDHEWSSMFLSQEFSGWTWFSIHLQNNTKLTLFTLLPSQGSPFQESWYGALITSDGTTQKLKNSDIEITQQSWQESILGKLPVSWHIKIESELLDLQVKVKKRQQISPFSIPYYEGAIEVTGNQKGVGFVEMTR